MNGAGEGLRCVVGLTGVKAVIELTQKSIEDVAQRRSMPVTVCSAPGAVVLDRARSRDGGEGPDKPHRRKPVVLHMTMSDRDRTTRCPGDRRGPGKGLKSASVREPATVVADLCQDPGTGSLTQTWKAGDDRVVRMIPESLSRRL